MGHISPWKQLGFKFPGPLSSQSALTYSSAHLLSASIYLRSPIKLAMLNN